MHAIRYAAQELSRTAASQEIVERMQRLANTPYDDLLKQRVMFGTPEAKVGLLPGGGSISRLPRQIPYAKAMEMLLVGDSFTAQQALEMGLLNYVVPREELLAKAGELARRMAQNGPLAVQKIKEGVLRSSGLPLARAYEVENEVSVAVMTSKDAREGPLAFKEKRKPNFTGE